MRTTQQEINNHIAYIERHSDYRVVRNWSNKKPTYLVMLNDELVAQIISDCKSDVWEMLNVWWNIAFRNDYEKRKNEIGK